MQNHYPELEKIWLNSTLVFQGGKSTRIFKTKNRLQIKWACDLAHFFEENDQSEKCSEIKLPLTLSQHFLLIHHGQNFVVNT